MSLDLDLDDVGGAFLCGGLVLGGIVFLLYLAFSKPEIDDCEKRGGMMVKSNGHLVCIDKKALLPKPEAK
jgi:hypothetical protein